jgi:hypothetical protein
MDKINKSKIIEITSGPKHHFFGFHDLEISNKKNTKILGLEVDEIDHPPSPGQEAGYGYIDRNTNQFIRLGSTTAWNFPQGARQQWIGDSNLFTINAQVDDSWGSFIVNSDSGLLEEKLTETIHALDANSGYAYGLNYSRLHRMGGYGYVGLEDRFKDHPFSNDDGIIKHNINTKEKLLLVSLFDIAHCDIGSSKPSTSFHHIVTHLCLNPSKTRLAFLHRYRIPDGGEITRLMTIGVNGEGLRCLASGFLSHFDWFDDQSLMIWGRKNESVDKLRANPLLAHPIVKPCLKIVKTVVKALLSKHSSVLNASFLRIVDVNEPVVEPFFPGLLTSDGHPMFNPRDRNWFINDTYPDDLGIRTLMLFNTELGDRHNIADFKMLDKKPSKRDIGIQTKDIDSKVLNLFSEDLYAFTRSGIHCDLHPRWLSDGHTVAFDSIHLGTRQIYTVDLSDIIK